MTKPKVPNYVILLNLSASCVTQPAPHENGTTSSAGIVVAYSYLGLSYYQ